MRKISPLLLTAIKDTQMRIKEEMHIDSLPETGAQNEIKFNFIPDSQASKENSVKSNNEKCHDVYVTGDKISEYDTFKENLVEKWVSKPHRDSEFASQGLCHVGEYTLMTSYDTSDTGNWFTSGAKALIGMDDWDTKTSNSRLDIVDEQGRTKTLYFNHDGHVGGIGFDNDSNNIYVSYGSKVQVFSTDTIEAAKNGETIKPDNTISVPKEVGTASYLTAHDGVLYIGKFDEEKDTKLAICQLNEKGEVADTKIVDVPYEKVQGFEVVHHNGQDYYLFSTSYGRGNDSKLIIATLNEDNEFERIGSVKMPAMAEQISLDKDGNLGIIFESDSINYAGSKQSIGNVLYIDIESIIDDKEAIRDKIASMLDIDREDELVVDTPPHDFDMGFDTI